MTDNPYDQFDAPPPQDAPGNGPASPMPATPQNMDSLPVITDDASTWAQPAAPPSNPYDQFDAKKVSGDILPMSREANGKMNWFDPNAGIAGQIGSAFSLPGDVMTGKVKLDPNNPATVGRVTGAAALAAPTEMGVGESVKAPVDVPTAKELHDAASQGYNSLRNLGVHYDPDHVGGMVAGTQDALAQLGLSNEVAPKTFAVLNKLGNPPTGAVSVPLAGLANARQVLGRVGQGADPVDRLASKKAISSIDDFIQNPPDEAVLAGDASQAGNLLSTSNANYAAAKRDDKVNAAGEYAKFRAASAHSGANFDNSLRQQLRPLVDPRYPQRLSGFSPEEKQGVADVVEGSGTRNTLRTTGNMMGGGGGSLAAIEGGSGALAGYEAGHALAGPMGGAAGAIAGGAIPFVGRGIRGVQNNMARSSLHDLSEQIRMRSPLYQERMNSAPLKAPNIPGSVALSGARASGAAGAANPIPDQAPPYAKGGQVKKPSHEFLVNRLMALAEKAKRAEKKATAPILNMPDDTVTAALAKAQEAI